MPLKIRFAAVVLLCVGTSHVAIAAGQPQMQAIAQAVDDLGDDRLETRLAAREFLWNVGLPARAALEEAVKSKDLEVASTARYLLARLNMGLTAQMPAELIAAAERFWRGTEADKLTAIGVLSRYQAAPVLLRLALHEPAGRARTQALEAAWKSRFGLMRKWLADGEWKSLEEFVSAISTATGDPRNMACYLTLRGQAEARIKQLQAGAARAPDKKLLAMLLRLKGDLLAATKAAEQAGDEGLTRDLAVEQGDWRRVAELPVPATIRDKNAWLASACRLAGDKPGLERQMETLKLEASTRHLASAFHGLELNDHAADAIRLMDGRQVTQQMAEFAAQGRVLEALACVGIDKAQPSYLGWLHNYYPQLEAGKVDGPAWEKRPFSTTEQVRYHAVLEAATILGGLGELEPAIELVDRLAEATEPSDRRNQLALYQAYRKLRSPPQTFACGARIVEQSKPAQAFVSLYNRGTNAQLVQFWWEYLGATVAKLSHEQRLEWADQLAFTSTRFPAPQKPSMEFLRAAEAWVLRQPGPPRLVGLAWLGESCLRYGNRPEAIGYLTQVADASKSSAINVQLGLLLWAEQRWPEAAERFRLAYEQDPSAVHARYLRGFALERAGKKRAGQYEIEQSRLILLGDSTKHYEVGKWLFGAGMYREAADEWQLCTRLVGCATAEACNANQGLGNAASKLKDPALAVRCWDRCTLSLADFFIVQQGAFTRFNHVIHSVRTRSLIEAGELDDALAHARLAFEAVPGDVDLPIVNVPLLAAAGREDAADQLFARTWDFYGRILKRFDKSTYHLNSAAWLAARCRRQLDEALRMSKEAVALEPQRWAYLDTLAEVHFQRGDRQQAIDAAAKAAALDPASAFLKGRLGHFKNDPLPQ